MHTEFEFRWPENPVYALGIHFFNDRSNSECNVCSDLQIPKRDKSNELQVCRNKLVGGTTLQVVFKG